MHRAARAQRGAVRWTVLIGAAVALAVAGAAAWFFLLRGDFPFGRSAPDFSFTLGRVTGEAVGEDAPREALRDAAEEVRETLDAMYLAAFMDPAKWQDGSFPEVLDAFTGEASRRARRDLESLTLGADAQHVDTVNPDRSKLRITFLVDANRSPVSAVARASFDGTGMLTDGRSLSVEHAGTYFMRPVDEGWRIVGYEVRGAVEPGPPPEPSP